MSVIEFFCKNSKKTKKYLPLYTNIDLIYGKYRSINYSLHIYLIDFLSVDCFISTKLFKILKYAE